MDDVCNLSMFNVKRVQDLFCWTARRTIFLSTAGSILRPSYYYYHYYFWLPCVFVAVRGLSLAVLSGGYSLLRCTGF